MEEQQQAIEPKFLSAAMESGIRLNIGQMNKLHHEGCIKDIGRYEINIDANGRIITLMKQEISFISAPHSILTIPASQTSVLDGAEHAPTDVISSRKPNIQQEFLDKAIKDNQPITIFLNSGQRIRGHLEAYDNFTLLLREGDRQHLFYKHAITTINR